MIKLKLPIWLNSGEILKLKNALEKFWQSLETWIKLPLLQFDVETCDEKLLWLFAYQRDIRRLINEPTDLYRKRIKYAFINAQDSGSVIGFIRIFERLGIGSIQLEERVEGYDWDVIKIILTDSQISKNHYLLTEIIRQYGRTCRRYFFEIVYVEKIQFNCGSFDNNNHCSGSKFEFLRTHTTTLNIKFGSFNNQAANHGAKYE